MDKYEFDNKNLTIIDEELGISYSAPFAPALIPKEPRNSAEVEKGHFLRITRYKDRSVEYYIQSGGVRDGQCILTYPNGNSKMISYYLKGQLHGPSCFYAENGQETIRSWFIEGNRNGKTLWFYSSGEKYSVQRYKDNLWQGKQEYWYADGTVKTVMNYDRGTIKGEVLLNHPTGKLLRQLNF